MITILVKEYNQFSQSFYDSVINSVQIHMLTCSCGHSACMTIHGYYKRSVQTETGKIKLRICRVKCSDCGRTHALLLSSIVAYSLVPLNVQRLIAKAFDECTRTPVIFDVHPEIDENCIRAIIRRYKKYWKQRLAAEAIPLDPAKRLVCMCLSLYQAQFMQVRSTFNTLFSIPT